MQTSKLQIFPALKEYFVLEIMLLQAIMGSLCLLMFLGGPVRHHVGYFTVVYNYVLLLSREGRMPLCSGDSCSEGFLV